MHKVILLVTITLLITPSVFAQRNYEITSTGAGGIRLGMTIGQARRVMKGCQFKRTSDAEGVALTGVTCRGHKVITLYSGEELADEPVDLRSAIEIIEVWDQRFRTASGVRVGMLLSEAEKRLGRVKNIVLSEIESREFVEFAQQPRNLSFRIYGGIYSPRSQQTKTYEKGTRLHSIQISKRF
jgi:hypothetical protein